MGAPNNMTYYEPKPVPKQIPLFEEEEDGKLTPYEKNK